MDLKLSDFPVLKSMRGLGISDSEIYSGRLQTRFSYTNTFYHREPALDLSRPDATESGKYDFVICSDVLEHVPGPVDRAFENLRRLLKPTGVLIVTAPYTLASGTIEHFSTLSETGLVEINGKMVLVNRLTTGEYEVFDQIAFHGGRGSTLEMRVFSEADLRARLIAAGMTTVQIDVSGSREFGVIFPGPCSVPILATRAPFVLSRSATTELIAEFVVTRSLLDAVKRSRWVRMGRLLGFGPNLRDEPNT